MGGRGRTEVLSENSFVPFILPLHCIALVCGTFLCFKSCFEGLIFLMFSKGMGDFYWNKC